MRRLPQPPARMRASRPDVTPTTAALIWTTRNPGDRIAATSQRWRGRIRVVTTTTIDRDALGRVIAVANGKGGVFKTSLTTTLAGLAARAELRVLLIDLDPQGNAGEDLGYDTDGGEALVNSLMLGTAHPLQPTIREVRTGVDVISGGEHLNNLAAMLVARGIRGGEVNNLLAASLADMVLRNTNADGDRPYDLILIDCPPGEPTLQLLALCAAKWLLIPTKADRASLNGMAQIASRLVEARQFNETIELLGVVLCDILTSAKKLRRGAEEKINDMLGGVAPLFENVIRNSTSAYNAREAGLLAHEYSEQTSREPFWKALKEGRSPASTGSAPALAEDYVLLADEILRRIAARENEMIESEAVNA